MSQAVIHNGVAYFSGQIPTDGATVADQTRDILRKIDRLLAEVGAEKADVLSATIWLADMTDFAAMNEVWVEWLGDAPRPVRACVGATLAKPEWKVEIQVMAAVAG